MVNSRMMKPATLLLMAAVASGSPAPAARAKTSTTSTAAFYTIVGSATASATPNSAPIMGSTAELVVYDADAIAAAVSAAVTDIAAPLDRRSDGVDSGLCIVILGIQIPAGCAETAGHAKTTTITTGPTTAAATCKTKTSAVLSTATPTSSYVSVPTTCTPVSWTNTNSYTSVAACTTAIEVGTYCGFINPEDPCAPQLAGKSPTRRNIALAVVFKYLHHVS